MQGPRPRGSISEPTLCNDTPITKLAALCPSCSMDFCVLPPWVKEL